MTKVGEGNDHKREKMRVETDVTRFCSSMRNQIEAYASLKGEQVAARVTLEDAEKDEWFMVKLIHFDREKKKLKYLMKNQETMKKEAVIGEHVLAVYPGTTTLYKATVFIVFVY